MDANGACYHIATPDQLGKLCKYSKDKDLDTIIGVWAATLRRDGKCVWDQAFYVVFNIKEDRKREAFVYRKVQNGDMIFCAELKYNLALRFCKTYLEEVSATDS